MTTFRLAVRSLRHYRATNLAVSAGVAVAVAVLTGALMVGDSVRASLRALVDERLGRAAVVVTSPTFFRQQLARDLAAQPRFSQQFAAVAPLIALEGAVVHERSGRQATGVQVFGVDDTFFPFHGIAGVAAPSGREALVSPALSVELQTANGDALLVRMQKPSAIPASSLQGRRDDTTRAVRVTVRGVLDAGHLGEFSLRTQQDAVRAVFVPISRLQRDLSLPDRANLLLLAASGSVLPATAVVNRLLAGAATLDDFGLRLVPAAAQHAWVLESDTGMLSDPVRAGAEQESARLGFNSTRVLTYLANTLRIGKREIPYSVVTGIDLHAYRQAIAGGPPDVPGQPAGNIDAPRGAHAPIWLNEWAADDLDATPGDEIELEFFRWADDEGLTSTSAVFTFAGRIPMTGAGGDRTLTPDYPGLTTATHIADWDPPFPVDLKRIRPKDEAYWETYRTAPKAFVDYSSARAVWSSPYGSATSLRIYVPRGTDPGEARDAIASALRRVYTPALAGMTTQAVREQALNASQGATDFGEYFIYFSFFIVVAGVLLTGLFFKLGLEQRARQIGLLFALGFTGRRIRALLLTEATVLAAVGACTGLIGAVLCCELILYGLRTWWVDAVGTTRLALAIRPVTLASGGAIGMLVAVVALVLTLRKLGSAAPRDLLSGLALMVTPRRTPSRRGRPSFTMLGGLALAGSLVFAGTRGAIGETAAFFAGGAVLLVAALWALSQRLRLQHGGHVHGHGWRAIAALGARQAGSHPGRSVLSVALIALATFVIVAVGAFRRGAPDDPRERSSGTGGYTLFGETAAPVMYDPGTEAGQRELALDPAALRGVRIERFRLRPGDDGSCLNLYKPASPRLVAPAGRFIEAGGFRFAASLAATDRERQNPWRLLERRFPDGAVPAIGDANSLQYVLHVGVGDDLLVPGPGGQQTRLRIVAALSDSIFQSELIIPEPQFTRLFPRLEGYRFFVMAPAAGTGQAVATALENGLADFGLDVQSTADRLASYHRVENTYLSTFQALGAFGLLLGTVGLGAILLRNVLERRRELALLQAVGYSPGNLGLMVIAESALLLIAGVSIGGVSAAIAVIPAFAGRGTPLPVASTALLLAAVLAAGLLSSLAATRVAAASPLLSALRTE